MKPRGPLMVEHRLIEKMLKVVSVEIDNISHKSKVDSLFIDTAVDFIKTYADRTHHGKEEEILFRDLAKKNLSSGDDRQMQELIEEHKYGRKTVRELVEAKENYVNGDLRSLEVIVNKLDNLIKFYPQHIAKEDKIFFPNTEKYFSEKELQNMLEEFWAFDKKMIHEKYANVVKALQNRQA